MNMGLLRFRFRRTITPSMSSSSSSSSTRTIQHQLSLPYILLPASKSLAKIHSARSRILTQSSTFSFTHCSKCYSYLFNGNAHLRLVRSRTPNSIRVLRRSCTECGHVNDTPVDRGNATLFTRRRQTTSSHPVTETSLSQVVQSAAHTPSPSTKIAPTPAPSLDHSQSSTTTAIPGRSKSRSKTKSVLQDMLSRKREKQDRDRVREMQGQGGLASFLNSL